MSGIWPSVIAGLLAGLGLAVPVWIASVYLKDASLADRFWSAFVAVPALIYVWRSAADARTIVMGLLVVAWALRLAVFVSLRNSGHGEDRRYAAMRERNQPHFAWKSLYLVFLLQAGLAWIVGLPVLAAAATGAASWSGWDTAAAVFAVAGLVMEAAADAQLARFRREPGTGSRVMDQGLWRYSRHPNYFGECCFWWGLGAMAIAGTGGRGVWALLSPLLMTILLLRVSGVSLLEKDIGDRRPGYRDYVARTSAFIPWPPRRARP